MRRGATVLAAGAAFALLVAANLAAKDMPKSTAERVVLQVEGMTCTGCEAKVERALEKIEGVQSVSADYKTGKVVVRTKGKVDKAALRKAVDKTGFKVVDKPGADHSKVKYKDCKGSGCCSKNKSSI